MISTGRRGLVCMMQALAPGVITQNNINGQVSGSRFEVNIGSAISTSSSKSGDVAVVGSR